MAMFDPSKLKVDFSDTSDLKSIENEKIKSEASKKAAAEAAKKAAEAEKLATEKVDAVVNEVPEDVLSDITETEPVLDTIVLEKNKIAEDKKYNSDSVDVDMRLNPTQDAAELSTIITDKELVEKDSVVKEFKKQQEADNLLHASAKKEIDINLSKLNDFISVLLREKYDYFRVEPLEDEVQITFVKDTVDKEIKFIKYSTYTRLLIEMKKAWKLKLEVTDKEQKWKGKYSFVDKQYDTLVKTKTNNYGESVYFKFTETVNTGGKKQKKKVSLSKILWFIVALLLTSLIIWGLFLGFILFNSNTIGDLTFFNDLWIDVDKIREFVAKLVNAIFFTIVFILTAFSIIYIFKAILTKKEFKKKKTASAVIALFLLILTVFTGFIWLTLSKKVAELKSANYGNPIIYDNTKLLSDFYENPNEAIINWNELIWPVSLKFDISELINKLQDNGNTIKKITWVFDGEQIEKPGDNTEIIQDYTTPWAKVVELIVDTIDLEGQEQVIEEEIAIFDIQYVVEVTEKTLDNGGKRYSFDARSLSNKWDVMWYYIPDVTGMEEAKKLETIEKALSAPILEGPVFSPQETLFEQELVVGMFIDEKGKTKSALDKIFIIGGVWEIDIDWVIKSSPALTWDLNYEIWIDDVENSYGNGFVDTVIWEIWGKEIQKTIDSADIKESSLIEFSFEGYGENKILATLIDTNGNRRVIQTDINVAKVLELKETIDIYNQDTNEKIGRYNSNILEHILNNLPTPTELKFDARYVTASNQLYALEKVEWDFDGDSNIDKEWKTVTHKIETVWNHHVIVHYTFKHRKVKDSIIKMQEDIYIDSEKKDVILNLQIEKESNYVPLVVRFDASRSQVKWEDIEKFIYDYGDGTQPESRDAINPWHQYVEPWDYTVTLTVRTKSGNEYSTTKELNLLARPQEIVISTSLKSTNTFQNINFSSDKSNWQISSYFWDFWDGTFSTVANPVKAFEKPWTYNVVLRWTFSNNNIEEDEVQVVITN
jgi:PKD repeat protein